MADIAMKRTVLLIDTEAKTETSASQCTGMKTSGRGGRHIELEVVRLRRKSLPSVHTVHVQATSKSLLSEPLTAAWTFAVVDTPFVVTVRLVSM